MKQGRNDTCACGSGLKYKKCCFDKQVANQVHDLELRRLQDTEKRLLPRLVRYAEDVFGGAAFDAAWMELTEGAFGESFNPDDELSIAYLPWFLYSWTVSDESMRDEADLWLGFEASELERLAARAGLERSRVVSLPSAWCGRGKDAHLPWQVLVAHAVRPSSS